MAKSLKCQICRTYLYDAKEAEDHAEATGHSNFAESNDPVPRLVCDTCGKPCRSLREWDLHKSRLGHPTYTDRTGEAPTPPAAAAAASAPPPPEDAEMTEEEVVLRAAGLAKQEGGGGTGAGTGGPTVVVEGGEGGSQGGGGPAEELVEPHVDPETFSSLLEMGFPRTRCVRAAFSTGSTSLEQLVAWLAEHAEDKDIDVPLLVGKSDEKPKTKLSPEEARLRAEDLMRRARERRANEERAAEREREANRIRMNKELLEAKRKEEDQERQRNIDFRRREKEELERAKEAMRRKLEEDRKERRRALGLPEELTPEEKEREAEKARKEAEKNANRFGGVIKPVEVIDRVRSVLQGVVRGHGDEKGKAAMALLLTLLGNVVRQPDEDKFRRVRLTNDKIKGAIVDVGAVPVLESCGFRPDPSDPQYLVLPREAVDAKVLNAAGGEIQAAITNPFFGKL